MGDEWELYDQDYIGESMRWGTNEMGDQWVGGTNEMGDQWNEWCMGANWGTNEMGDQWDGGPMRWGTNEMGDQWCAPFGLYTPRPVTELSETSERWNIAKMTVLQSHLPCAIWSTETMSYHKTSHACASRGNHCQFTFFCSPDPQFTEVNFR